MADYKFHIGQPVMYVMGTLENPRQVPAGIRGRALRYSKLRPRSEWKPFYTIEPYREDGTPMRRRNVAERHLLPMPSESEGEHHGDR